MAKKRYSALQKEYWGYEAALFIGTNLVKLGTVGQIEKEANKLLNYGLTTEVAIKTNPNLKTIHFIHRRN